MHCCLVRPHGDVFDLVACPLLKAAAKDMLTQSAANTVAAVASHLKFTVPLVAKCVRDIAVLCLTSWPAGISESTPLAVHTLH